MRMIKTVALGSRFKRPEIQAPTSTASTTEQQGTGPRGTGAVLGSAVQAAAVVPRPTQAPGPSANANGQQLTGQVASTTGTAFEGCQFCRVLRETPFAGEYCRVYQEMRDLPMRQWPLIIIVNVIALWLVVRLFKILF